MQLKTSIKGSELLWGLWFKFIIFQLDHLFIGNLEKLVDDLTDQMQGNQSKPSQDSVMVAAASEEGTPENIINKLERRMQVAEEEMEHKLADITNKNTAKNTFQQKIVCSKPTRLRRMPSKQPG